MKSAALAEGFLCLGLQSSLLDRNCFFEDFFAAEDGEDMIGKCQGQRDAIAGSSVDFQERFLLADLLFEIEAGEIDRVFDVCNYDLDGFDAEAAEYRIDQIMGVRAGLMFFSEVGLDIAADRGICIDSKPFLLGP
jgi:hypothetical protein